MPDLSKWASENKYKAAWGDIKHLYDAFDEYESRNRSNELNELQSSVLKEWVFDKDTIKDMKTVIIVAASAGGKTRKIIFDLNGAETTVFMPPFYTDYKYEADFDEEIYNKLSDFLKSHGYKVNRLSGPKKNLAARLGLGKYGRNNLIYVDGYGSYIRLLGFVTDAKFTPESLTAVDERKLTMDSCKKCNVCKMNCPTKAISDDRFQLDVDKCLAYHNEKTDEWPEFIHNIKQNYLVGCLNCQYVCPHNKGFTDVGSTISGHFDKGESDFILGQNEHTATRTLERVYEKLDEMGLSRYKDFIIRNIREYISHK